MGGRYQKGGGREGFKRVKSMDGTSLDGRKEQNGGNQRLQSEIIVVGRKALPVLSLPVAFLLCSMFNPRGNPLRLVTTITLTIFTLQLDTSRLFSSDRRRTYDTSYPPCILTSFYFADSCGRLAKFPSRNRREMVRAYHLIGAGCSRMFPRGKREWGVQ